MNIILTLLVVEFLCILGVTADYYLKIAGSGESFVNYKPFVIGFLIHASTAIGWFLVLKYMTLTQLGVIYSISIVLLLTAVGVIYFGEVLRAREVFGIVLAIASLLLMARFA